MAWRVIYHPANLSSSTPSWKTLLHTQMGGQHRQNTQVTDGFLTTPFPTPPPQHTPPSLRKVYFTWREGKCPTSPNTYEIFTEESYLQFLLNIKLPPLQQKDNPIYKP